MQKSKSKSKKTGRVKGYHYETDSRGNKHRVYSPAPRAMKGNGAYMNGRQVSRAAARASLFRGKGGFLEELGGVAGTLLGGPGLGTAIGAGLGGLAGKITGLGAYHVKANSLLDEGQSPAAMHSIDNRMVVRHREYIQDIISSGTANTFTLQSFPINPGLESSFPWLAPIAQQFEEYRILGMIFEFKTLSADAISSSQANMTIGGVIMATDYNSANPNFVNKQSMDNTQYTTSCKPSESLYHAIECNPRENPVNKLYVRPGAVPSGYDERLYDLGIFQVASFGVAATTVTLGELWCTYEVELSKPINTNGLGTDVLADHYQLFDQTNSKPLGTTQALEPNSSINGTINSAGTVYSFPAWIQEGYFLVTWVMSGTQTAITIPSPEFAGFNCTRVSIFQDDDQNYAGPVTGDTVTVLAMTSLWKITGPAPTITWESGGTYPASSSVGDLFVSEWNGNITQ